MTAPSLATAGLLFDQLFLVVNNCRNAADPEQRVRTRQIQKFLLEAGFKEKQPSFTLSELDEIGSATPQSNIDKAAQSFAQEALAPHVTRQVGWPKKEFLRALRVSQLKTKDFLTLKDSPVWHLYEDKVRVEWKAYPTGIANELGTLPFPIAAFLASAPGLRVRGWTKELDTTSASSWKKPVSSLLSGLLSDSQLLDYKELFASGKLESPELRDTHNSAFLKLAIDFSVLRFIQDELFGSSMWVDGSIAPWMIALQADFPSVIQARKQILEFFKDLEKSHSYDDFGRYMGKDWHASKPTIRSPKEFYLYVEFTQKYLFFLKREPEEFVHSLRYGAEEWAPKQFQRLIELRRQIQI